MVTKTKTVREAVTEMNKRLMDSFSEGDAARVALLYTTDGQLLPTGTHPVEGPEKVQAYWQQVMDAGIKEVQLKTRELEECGEVAVEIGTYRLKGPDGEEMDEGKYMVMWKQEDEQWKIHRYIWNSSLPVEQ